MKFSFPSSDTEDDERILKFFFNKYQLEYSYTTNVDDGLIFFHVNSRDITYQQIFELGAYTAQNYEEPEINLGNDFSF